MNPQSVAPTLNVRANGKTAPGTGWENGSGFSNYSMTHSVFALMVNRILSRKGAADSLQQTPPANTVVISGPRNSQ